MSHEHTASGRYKRGCEGCLALRNEYKKQWREENDLKVWGYQRRTYNKKRAWLNQIKQDAGCADCGYDEHPEALEHVEGEKVAAISELMNKGRATILREIEKCEVVCANCHRIRSYDRRQPGYAGGYNESRRTGCAV